MTNNKRLFLDIHVIQTVPPSNINRDDTGSPKTAQYGGVQRSRVSSQSWKRAIRSYFYENSDEQNVGIRTLNIVKYVADKIKELDNSIEDDDAMELADKTIKAAGVKTKEQKARALFFLGDTQAEELAKAAIEGEKDKKVLKNILGGKPSVDMALFGRMVADDPSLNVDATSQVAHAISTHAVQTEFDFYTAVDDLATEDNAGAGMLGTIEYNSSTLYRYANVAIHELLKLVDDKNVVKNSIKLYLEAFVNSLPTGKVNTFGNQTLPQAVFVTLRSDRPVNLVSAFEEPIKSTSGYADKSIGKLVEEYNNAQRFVKEPISSLCLLNEKASIENENIYETNSLHELVDDISKTISTHLSE